MDKVQKPSVNEKGWGGVDWIALAQDRDQWRPLVNTLVKFRVPYNAGKIVE
jgi:hypothetical protein